MPELRLADVAEKVALLEDAAALTGGGQVYLGAMLSAHPSAEGFRKWGASGTIRNYTLRDVVLDGDNLVLFKDGIPIRDTFYLVSGDEGKKAVVRKDAVTDLYDDCIYIIVCNVRQHHYGHWMMQCLPAIDWSLRNHLRDNVCLVMRAIEPWQEDTLNLLGYGSVPRLAPEPGKQYRIASAEYSEFTNGAAAYKMSLCLAGTARHLQKPIAPSGPPFRVLYVPLIRSFYGDIANEMDLMECLTRHGVHAFSPDTLSISERVSMFRQADVVIGAHSDDLADVMFCKPGAVLWEFMPRHYQNFSNNRLAQSVGMHYWADLFETVGTSTSPDWVVDLDIVSARLAQAAKLIAEPAVCLPVRGMPLGNLMTQFESLGDNCEFGLVQRQAESEPLGLLRFASFQVPVEMRFERLIDALEKGFAGLGDADTIEIAAEGLNREFMVRDRIYRLLYHTFRHEGETDIESLRASEPRRLGFLRRKFLDDLASGEKIFVWQSRATTNPEQVTPLLDALRGYGPNTLLWVTEADAQHAPGSIETLGHDLLRGYVARFAPPANATDIDAAPWFQVCRKIYEARGGKAAEIADDMEKAEAVETGAIKLTHAPRSTLGAGLQVWLKSTITPDTSPDELRAKARYFLKEAAKAEVAKLRSEFRSLAYTHYKAADDIEFGRRVPATQA